MTDPGPGDNDSDSAGFAESAVLDTSSWVPSGPDSPFTGNTDD